MASLHGQLQQTVESGPDRASGQTQLQPGEIVAFSISPTATADDFPVPTFLKRLEDIYFGTYLGIVTFSKLEPVVILDDEGRQAHGDQMVEVYHFRFIASDPPDLSMLVGNEEVLPMLPNHSFSFASLPIDQGTSGPVEAGDRSPLTVVGDGTLPIPKAFAYTISGPSFAHLGTLHDGPMRLRLAEGELMRLMEAGEDDQDVFSEAHDSFTRQRRQEARARMASTEPYVPNVDDEHVQFDMDQRINPPTLTHVVLDVWKDWRELKGFSHPSEFAKEKELLDRALAASWQEEPRAVLDWAEHVQQEPSVQSDPWSSKAAFAIGFILGAGTGVLGTILFRTFKLRH